MAPSVTGVEPEATARRFSSGRVGRGHSYFYGELDTVPKCYIGPGRNFAPATYTN
jgi:hypothetical protein